MLSGWCVTFHKHSDASHFANPVDSSLQVAVFTAAFEVTISDGYKKK